MTYFEMGHVIPTAGAQNPSNLAIIKRRQNLGWVIPVRLPMPVKRLIRRQYQPMVRQLIAAVLEEYRLNEHGRPMRHCVINDIL